jgi:hypothetical protein
MSDGHNWMQAYRQKLNAFFGGRTMDSWSSSHELPNLTSEQQLHLAHFNLEWYWVPPADVLPLNREYFEKMYPLRARDFERASGHHPDYSQVLREGHARQQGCIVAVETTPKPNYLPGNGQQYGSLYGFENTAEPLAPYIGRAGFHNGTRYDHTYTSLYELIKLINEDWSERGLMPPGYRLTICPPALWNFVGTIFHLEWSQTQSLEMGFYRDDGGNAHCYALGSSQPGDYSYIRRLEQNANWSLLGFRTALLPLGSQL